MIAHSNPPIRIVLLLVLMIVVASASAAEPSKIRASSMVLVSEPRLPAATAFRATLEQRLAGRHKIDDMEADGQKVILLRVRGGTVMIGLIDAPVPKGSIDGLCRTAWYWRDACEATSLHRGHIFVSVLDTDLDRLDARLLQTDVVASLMDANAIASYWEASLQSREAFLKQSAAASRDNPPVLLWVNFRVSRDPEKGLSISTDGMEAFDLREIEAKDVKGDGSEVFGLLAGMAAYLIQKGPVIKDGETIGESPSRNIRVRQGPSYWRPDTKVYRVLFP